MSYTDGQGPEHDRGQYRPDDGEAAYNGGYEQLGSYGEQPAPMPHGLCYRHPDRETYVQCTRCEKPICSDCMQQASVGFQCPDCVRGGNRGMRSERTVFGGSMGGSTGTVTYTLIGINVLVFLISAITAVTSGYVPISRLPQLLLEGGYSPVYEFGAMIGSAPGDPSIGVEAGQWWRPFTGMFLHAGALHLAFNCWAIYVLGRECERLLGRWRYLALYLIAGLGGSVAILVLDTNQPTVGASGAIFGLLGAMVFFFRRLQANLRGLLTLLVANLAITFFVPGISILGHLGGLVTGAVLGALITYAPEGKHRTAIQIAGLATVALLLIIGAIAFSSTDSPF